MASPPPLEIQPSDETDSLYTDAASVAISEPNYVDALSVSAADDKQEVYCDVSSSSNIGTLNTASSGSPDSSFHDAEEVQPLREQPTMNEVSQQPPMNGDHHQYQDDRRVYFELEKRESTGEDTADESQTQKADGKFKGKTLTKAKVNVAARARLFEVTNADTKDDVTYDIPPPRSTANDIDGAPGKRSSLPSRNDVYEITVFGDSNQGNKDFQSNLEGSGIYEVVGNSQAPKTAASKPDSSEEQGPLVCSAKSKPSPPSPSTPTELSGSGGFLTCKQGTPRQDPVQVFLPSHNEIETEYNRLQFSRNAEPKSTPEEAGYHSLDRHRSSPRDPSTSEPIYDCAENIGNRHSWDSEEWSDGSWGSSEFEEDETEEGYMAEPEFPAPTKPLPRKPRQSNSDSLHRFPALLNKFKPNRAPIYEDIDAVCLPVTINTSKHPPPALPPPPPGLSDSETKRRCVVELTISSERSYIDSLERIVQEYEKQILEVIPHPKAHVRSVFRESREILNHHKMFQIQLSDTVRSWDKDGMIGDIFTASFSKSMLVDAYSNYVNNFAAGMDEIRTVQQNRPNFEEFLKNKEKSSYDRLSIFGLMVKPIQRFPQFIMLLQDLIKYTSHSHKDRRHLQLALTELENVTHKLNERKRLSEQYFQATQTMQLLPRQLPSQVLSSRNMEKPRRLIRFDNFDQIDGEMENMKSSTRRLILMDDLLVCVKVGLKDQDGFMMERYRLKWAARLCDVDLKDTAMTPDMRNVVKMDPKRLNMLASQLEKPAEDPFHLYADLRDMLHDLTVFGNITNLMQSLRRNYQGYVSGSVRSVS
ncbi:hypothetical protein V1264_007693 [Littorina saxatilis]|uniref:DH domain-containing protein n=1 Tax=Littorina saxatilis TaxID=31220 RepID=A0AAN9AVW2_9CAEN